MSDFIYPLLSVVIDFICLLMCIKFIFSKRGGFWIVPVLLSLIFLAASAFCLLAQTSTKTEATMLVFAKALSIFLLGASAIWLLTITLFRIALNPDDIQSVKAKRNKVESDFLKNHTSKDTFWEGGDANATFKHPIKSKEQTALLKKVPDYYKEVTTGSSRSNQNEE